jgi:galactose mutarotase-like enzyme
MNSMRRGEYCGVPALVLENDLLRTVVLPDRGSKMASLLYKPDNVELLWQPPDGCYPPARYADPYDARHATGFDEMFPSISSCHYEAYPWAGTTIPDHGEVWSMPWAWTIEHDEVSLEVYGVRFPYRLNKRIRLQPNCVEIAYQATNLSCFDMDFLWAAHPLFSVSPGVEIAVPPDMGSIVNAAAGPRLPEYGQVYSFPHCQSANGATLELNRVPPYNGTGYQKYYFSGPSVDGWCELRSPRNGLSVRLAFPVQEVPYLGMWVNEGGWNGQYNMAPEPATGAMDRIDAAKLWGMNSILPAHQSKSWWLHISVNR